MDVLYTTSALATKIKSMFKNSKGRRVVIVAFIGSKADHFLPNQKGVEIYCWPKPGGTNPKTLKTLIKNGAVLKFVDRVHMKVYWTSDQGAVITSANLSTSALGENGLREIGVHVPSSNIDIDKIVKSLNTYDVTSKKLQELEVEYSRLPGNFREKNGADHTFIEWFNQKGIRQPFHLGWFYDNDKVSLAVKAKQEAKELWGTDKMYDWMNVSKTAATGIRESLWMLSFSLGPFDDAFVIKASSVHEIGWFYADLIVPILKSEDDYSDEWPYQVVQAKPRLFNAGKPFEDKDPKFKKAFKKAVLEYGREKIIAKKSLVPNSKLIDLIAKNYQ